MKIIKEQTNQAALIVSGLGIVFSVMAIIFILLGLNGCGKRKELVPVVGPSGAPGASGSKGDTGDQGATGQTGAAGTQGNAGTNGTNGAQGYGAGIKTTQLSVGNANCPNGGVQLENFQDLNNNGTLDTGESLLGLTYVCNGSNGSNGSNGTNGSNGSNGSNGTNGTNGTNGVSTTFSIVTDNGTHCTNGGFDLTLTDSTHSETDYVCNGNNGANGQNGQAGTNGTNGSSGGTVSFSLVQAIEPCGANSSPWKETLLGLQGGQILASFSETVSGQNTRFAFIPNGSYIDTDSSGCNFSVTGDGTTWSQINWGSGSNVYSTWVAGGYHWTSATGWVAL